MPLVYQHTINSHSRLGIWHITEPESFFRQQVPLLQPVAHSRKRLQHLAGRYLLRRLFPEIALETIAAAPGRKPFLPNESHHFSISHCGHHAAVIASTTQQAGIDIEIAMPKIMALAPKFLRPDEETLLQQYREILQPIAGTTLLWSAKEALFKWYARGGIDFKEHLHIQHIEGNNKEGILNAAFRKDGILQLQLPYVFFDNLVLTWVLA